MKLIFHNYKFSWLEFLLLLCSILLLGWAITSQIKDTGWSIWFETNRLDHIGSFMGGLFAIISIFYLIKNLSEQNQITTIQSFERNFLEIVKFCRDQVKEAKMPDPNSSDGLTSQLSGREVFSLFYSQIEDAIKEIQKFLEDKSIKDLFISEQEFKRQQQLWGDRLTDRTIAAIAYIITYIGVRKQGYELLIHKYLTPYNTNNIEHLMSVFRQKLAEYAPGSLKNASCNRLTKTEILNCKDKVYHGFQDVIGNYFRLLYQAVVFVDNQSILSYKEKYKYVKMLRGQMSNMEEIILFYNSLCDLGLAWEYNVIDNKSPELITKYNLIKNIPSNFTKISFDKFYPNINYEYLIEEPPHRKKYET